MDRLLRSLITVEKAIQIVALVGVAVFVGYLGLSSYQGDRAPSLPGNSPTMQK